MKKKYFVVVLVQGVFAFPKKIGKELCCYSFFLMSLASKENDLKLFSSIKKAKKELVDQN